MRWSVKFASVAVLVLVCLPAGPLWAQSNTATLRIETQVADLVPLPGVVVVAVNLDTGIDRSAVSDARGQALLQGLAPGSYRVTAALEGFESSETPSCDLRVGQTVMLNLVIRPKVEAALEVNVRTPLVEIDRREAAVNVVPEQIRQLPVIDRKYERLAFVTPGVQPDRVQYYDRAGGPVIGAAATGAQTVYLIDGVELTDPITGLARQRLSQDAVREFRVSRQGFSAEIGGSSSGAITIVTRTGGNETRGSVFGFFRADALRATGALELEEADFTRSQLGVTLGGPVVRDRTHYFISAEHLDDRNVAFVRPGGSLGALAADVPTPVKLTSTVANLTHRFSERGIGTARLILESYRQDNYDVGGVVDESHGWRFDRDAWTLILGHSWVIGEDRLNEIGFQVGVRDIAIPANSSSVGEWLGLGNSLRTGGTVFGPDGLLEGEFAEIREAFSWQLGEDRHLIKAGLRWMHLEQVYREDRFGFGLLLSPDDSGQFPLSYYYGVGSSTADQVSDQWGVFVNDEFRVSDTLTVGMGLRWDVDVGGNNPDFGHPLVSDERGVDTDNVQPRFGFAWNPSADGRTVLRGGIGRYTGRTRGPSGLYELMFNGVTARTLRRNVSVPNLGIWIDPSKPELTGVALAPDIWLLDDEAPSPESTQVGLGLSHRLGESGLNLDIDTIYVEGRKEIALVDSNWRGNQDPCQSGPAPAVDCRIDPDYTQVQRYSNDGHSRYRALTVGVSGTIPGGHLLTTALTVADKKNIADDPGDIYALPNDPADLEAEWGRADTDERARLVVTGIFHLPWRLTLAPVYEYGSGQPWTRLLGFDANSDGYPSDRSAGVDRNDQSGPSYSNLSVRIARTTPLRRGELEVILEVFNLLNTVNYDVSSVLNTEAVWDSTMLGYVPNPDLGRYTATLPPREVQLGFRYSF